MFGLEYFLSLIKVFVIMGSAIVWAIPVNFIWSKIGYIYFPFLSEKWLNIPYWHIVGLTILISFIGSRINALTPKIVNIKQINNKEQDNGN